MTANAALISEYFVAFDNKVKTARSNAASYRQDVADQAANPTVSAFDLADSVNKLAEAQGALAYWSRMRQVAEYALENGSDGNVSDLFDRETISALTRGADDAWSGRGNDSKRAYFDGLRAAAADLRWVA